MHIRANEVRTRLRQGKVGMPAKVTYKAKSLVNQDPQAAQVDTITVDTATALHEYTFEYDGVEISFTALAAPTTTTVAAGLAAAFNDNPAVRGKATAEAALAIITITANNPGLAYVLDEVDALCTDTSVTVAASADAVPFGALMVNPSGYVTDEADEYGVRAKSTLYTPQVVTVTPVYAVDTDTTVRIRDMHSGRIIAETTMRHDTNLADLIAEIVADLETQLPAVTVKAADVASTSITLTAELAGFEFDVEVGVGEGVAAAPSTCAKAYTTGPTPATSLLRSIEGVSLYAEDEEITTVEGTDASYPANAGVRVMTDGEEWVSNSQTIVHGTPVYVEMSAASASRGYFYNTTSATRLLLPLDRFVWERDAESNSGNIAVLKLTRTDRP